MHHVVPYTRRIPNTAPMSLEANRQKRNKAFQTVPAFGINIQGANQVVHRTRTWNPAKEAQAMGRAYRIGQRMDAYVYQPVVFAEDFHTFAVKLDQLLAKERDLPRDTRK